MRYGAGLMATAGVAPVASTFAASRRRIPIGLQLYSVRGECQKDFAGTVAKVAQMGYQGVEFAGYYNWPAAKVRKLLDENGLKCCGTHAGLTTLLGDEFERTVEFNKTIGNKYLVVPGIPGQMRPDSKSSWVLFAKLMNELAEKAAEHGMQVGYHNHAHEFQSDEDYIPWEVFAKNSREDVILQVDIGHVVRAGADPAKHMKRYPGRLTTVHIKEFSKTNRDPLVGEGDVDWPAMFSICEGTGGTQWYIIEDESRTAPLERVQKDLQNLRRLLRAYHA
ncbi:MAG: sugar phosphate isomerase/epimerase family protein, partial [Planctomycetota bacterium]|jgi:sugar phosphate isomerase/epimerase